jgi:hypothetical protein
MLVDGIISVARTKVAEILLRVNLLIDIRYNTVGSAGRSTLLLAKQDRVSE